LKNSITIKNSILINKPKSLVWDFTQNYTNRPIWDNTVVSTEILHAAPNRMVKLKMKGNTTMTFIYKLDDRPNKTSLKAIDIESAYIKSAGGSWTYEEQNGVTNWTRVDTIVLKDSVFMFLYIIIFKWIFAYQIRNAMKKVKLVLEMGDSHL
jgi:uncharacterized membrane protein